MGEVFQTVPKRDYQRLWKGLLEVVQPIVDEARFLPSNDTVREERHPR